MTTLLNPTEPGAFGRYNVVMSGRARRHFVGPFEGPLSLKGVLEGVAEWSTPERRHVLHPDALLVLNDRQTYSLTIDAHDETETFCVFFARGEVEGAVAALSRPDQSLIYNESPPSFGFHEQVHSSIGELGSAWRALALRLKASGPAGEVDWHVGALARRLAQTAIGERGLPHRLRAARSSTRDEILRRLRRSREAMEADLARPWTLAELGHVAALSPHHFHRCHREVFGETPRAYLARRRLERALVMLRSGRETVTGACLAVGYQSLGSFSLAFRRQFGQPPSHFARVRAAPLSWADATGPQPARGRVKAGLGRGLLR